MKLFFKMGTCSLAPHIILAELELIYELVAVDLQHGTTHQGNYKLINPKGLVPALQLDNDQVLTETAVLCQYLADLKPEAKLIPIHGSFERYICLEWLNFIATEIHNRYSLIFKAQKFLKEKSTQEELKASMKEVLRSKLAEVSQRLDTNNYLMGQDFSVADAYMFTILSWSSFMHVDLSPWPNLENYLGRVKARPAVMRALKEQKLV